MRPRTLRRMTTAGAMALCISAALAQAPTSTAITYQGQLKQNGMPVTGVADFRVYLYSVETGGTPEDSLACYGTAINDGLFALDLNFDPTIFNGDGLWLEIHVACPSGSTFVALTPRQPLRPAPYALFALDGNAVLTLPYAAICPLDVGDAFAISQPTAGAAAIHAEATGGNGQAVHATASAVEGTAVQADATGDALYAVVGTASARGTVTNYGGLFTAAGDRARAVLGYATATSGYNYGVYGRSDSSTGRGVYGVVPADSGNAYGVYGEAASQDGIGVFGYNDWEGAGPAIAVRGSTNSPDGFGGWFEGRGYFSGHVGIGTTSPGYPLQVYADGDAAVVAENPAEDTRGELGSPNGGVVGQATTGYGVVGLATDEGTVTNVGVKGEAGGTTGRGVHGHAYAPTGATAGVYGSAVSSNGRGVYGECGGDYGRGVAGNATGAAGYGVHGSATTGTGVYGESAGGHGVSGFTSDAASAGVYGTNEAETGNAIGVWGWTGSASGFAGYFEGQGYFSGKVGIGTTTPTSPLTVAGLVESTTDGFKFPDGTVQTTAAAGSGGSLWTEAGSDIYFDTGRVGIGTDAPAYALHVYAGADAAIAGENLGESTRGELGSAYGGVFGEATTASGTGIYGQATNAGAVANAGVRGDAMGTAGRGVYGWAAAPSGTTSGVYGQSDSPNGRGVFGHATATSGTTYGVYGTVDSSGGSGVFGESTVVGGYGVSGRTVSGAAIFGEATATTGSTRGVEGFAQSPDGAAVLGYNEGESGNAIGVKGETSSATGFGGYFVGRGYFSGRVGVGTTSPATALDVIGKIKAIQFQLTDSPSAGYVLTSDSAGNAAWEPVPTFSLPYNQTLSYGYAAFKVVNTGTEAWSHGIWAEINSGSSDPNAAAGYFTANGSNGRAVLANSDHGTAVSAYHTGSNYAYFGSSNGAGGAYFTTNTAGGFGVKGVASASTGLNTVGGWFESYSSAGKGVVSLASGYAGTAITAESTGSAGVGVFVKNVSAEAPALLIRNENFGPFIRAQNSTTNTVFEVANDGTTSVTTLHITGGADLAENFPVSGAVTPGTVVEIDPDHPGQMRIACGAYNRRVAGVISGANDLGAGMVLGDLPGLDGAQPIALSGRVWVQCDARSGAISPGDLLTTAERPGHAMRVDDFDRAHGAVLGKAMSSLAAGETGMVLVLVNLQ